MTLDLLRPSAPNASECNVLKYGKSFSSRPNFSTALCFASLAAFFVKEK